MVRPNLARTILSYILSVAVISAPSFAFARPSSDKSNTPIPVFTAEFDGQQFDGLRRFERQTPDDATFEKELNRAYAETGGDPIEKIENKNDLVQTIRYYHQAYLQARDLMRAEYARLGPVAFAEKLNKDEIVYDIPGAGKVEFSAVDGIPTGRITDRYSGVKIIFTEPEVERDAKAYNYILSRMWYDSGYKRPTYKFQTPGGEVHKIPLGRDVIVVSVSGDKVTDNGIQLKPKPTKIKDKIPAWWRATMQAPTWYTLWVGSASAAAQSGSAYVLSKLFEWGTSHFWHMQMAASHAPTHIAYISAGMAFTLGVFTRSFQNWRSRGIAVRQLERKDQSTNVVMYLLIKSISPGGITQLINIHSPASTVFSLAQLEFSLVVSKKLRQPFNRPSDIMKRLRQDQGWQSLRIPIITRDENGEYHVASIDQKLLKKTDWYRQFLLYLPRNAMTQTDRMWFTWMEAQYRAGAASWYSPWLSTLGLVMMIPVTWAITRKWVQKNYAGTEEQRRTDEDASQYLNPRKAALSVVQGIPFVGEKWALKLDRSSVVDKSSVASCSRILKPAYPYDDVQ